MNTAKARVPDPEVAGLIPVLQTRYRVLCEEVEELQGRVPTDANLRSLQDAKKAKLRARDELEESRRQARLV